MSSSKMKNVIQDGHVEGKPSCYRFGRRCRAVTFPKTPPPPTKPLRVRLNRSCLLTPTNILTLKLNYKSICRMVKTGLVTRAYAWYFIPALLVRRKICRKKMAFCSRKAVESGIYGDLQQTFNRSMCHKNIYLRSAPATRAGMKPSCNKNK